MVQTGMHMVVLEVQVMNGVKLKLNVIVDGKKNVKWTHRQNQVKKTKYVLTKDLPHTSAKSMWIWIWSKLIL